MSSWTKRGFLHFVFAFLRPYVFDLPASSLETKPTIDAHDIAFMGADSLSHIQLRT